AFAKLDEAQKADPMDTRSRLTAAAIYLTRIMPARTLPPGFDRKEALAKAEALLDEVLRIDPKNQFALGFQSQIDQVRASMGRPRPGAAVVPPAGAPPAR